MCHRRVDSGGENGQNVRRHSQGGPNASMIKQKKSPRCGAGGPPPPPAALPAHYTPSAFTPALASRVYLSRDQPPHIRDGAGSLHRAATRGLQRGNGLYVWTAKAPRHDLDRSHTSTE